MQDYIALRIDATPCNETVTDLLAAFLGDIGYESFTPDETGLTAYIQSHLYDPESLEEIFASFPMETDFSYGDELVEGQDWNEEWEKHYFQPIVIGEECVVHSSFHTDIPSARYDIVIDPKMAFGTGHHSTTSQMMRHILDADVEGKEVIDMGTGTGILAILCKMCGAGKVSGIEIDPFAYENAVENARLNGTELNLVCGDASALENLGEADYFLANINRNVITADIEKYAAHLRKGGTMFLSGFYESDLPIIEEGAIAAGLHPSGYLTDKDWVALKLVKND